MLKTLKSKIALVAVAGLGFGLVSTVPANAAAADTVVANLNLTQANSTLVVTAGAGNTADTAKARAGVQTLKITEGAAVDTAYHIAVTTAACNAADATMLAGMATLTGDAGTAIANAATVNTYTAGKIVVVTPAADASTLTITTASLSAGTWNVCADSSAASSFATDGFSIGAITVYNVGAPSTVSFDQVGRTQIAATATDSSFVASVKDSSGRSTFLRGSEAITYSLDTVASGVCAPATPANSAAADQAYDAATGVFTGYTVAIDNTNPGTTGCGGGDTTAGVTYKLNGTIISGLAAFGTTSATYRWAASTSGLAGTLRILKQSDSSAVTAISLPASGTVAATDYKWELKDSTGAVVQGVTPTSSSSAASTIASSAATGAAGTGNAFTYTAAATAGTDTLTFTVTAGSSASITASVAVTVTGYGATKAALASSTITAGNGTGFVAGTAPAYTAGLTVTKVNAVVTGLDANKVAAVSCSEDADAGANSSCSVDAATPVADAAGKITIVMTIAGTVNNADIYSIAVDADGAGAVTSTTIATVTWATATADVTTSPANGTNTFAAASATIPVVATAADQFSVASPGATVTMTNTVVPVGATAQTAATQTVGADGKSTFSVVLGSKAGTYTYTFTGLSYNNVAMATTNTVSFTVTASGAPAAITVTGGANTSTTIFRVRIDADGDISTADADKSAGTATTVTTKDIATAGTHTVMTVKVTDDSGAGAAGVVVTAAPGDGVLVNSAAAANVLYSAFNSATTDLKIATNAQGIATFYVAGSKVGTGSVTFSAGTATVKGEFLAIANSGFDTPAAAATGRVLTLSKATSALNGNVDQIIATVKDVWGNPVAGVALTGAITGTAGRFTGGGRTQAAVNTDANGQVVFEVTSNGVETGAGTLTVAGTDGGATTNFLATDLTANGSIFTAASTKSATAALTVTSAAAASSPAIDAVKADVKAVSDTVATLSKAVTTIQSSVTELTSSFSAQIKSLSSAIAKISRAIAALSKKIK